MYTSGTNSRTKCLNFFVSHDGLGGSWLRFSGIKPSESAKDRPKVAYILFTPRLPRLYAHSTYGSARRPAAEHLPAQTNATCKLEAHNSCSAWLVLKADESGSSVYQKVGVLRSDEAFRLRWVTEGLLRAHLRSGCIFIDTTNTPKPKTTTVAVCED